MPVRHRHALIAAGCLSLACCASARPDAQNPYERHVFLEELEGNARFAAAAINALGDADWRVAATACALAMKHRVRAVAEAAVRLLAEQKIGDERLEYLLRLVGDVGRPEDATTVALYLSHRRPTVRGEALAALERRKIGRPGNEHWIAPLVSDKHKLVRARALDVLLKYDTPEAAAIWARHFKSWDKLAELAATGPLLEGIRHAPPAGRPPILARVARSPVSNQALMVAILADPGLEALHPAAIAYLERRKEALDAVAQTKQRLTRLWEDRVAKEVAGCSTDGWYGFYQRLRGWSERPQYDFLGGMLKTGFQSCREAALKVVAREAQGGRRKR